LNKITLFIVNVWAGAGTSNPLTHIHSRPTFFVIRRCTTYIYDDRSFPHSKIPRHTTLLDSNLEARTICM